MNRYGVELSARAEQQLLDIEAYISTAATRETGRAFARSLLQRCLSLKEFPLRGTQHNDLRPGLRSIPYRRTATIYYVVDDLTVTIIAVTYGGRDAGTALEEQLN